jgi:integrase
MGIYRRTDSPFYWLQYTVPVPGKRGQRIQENSHTESEAEAWQLLQRRKHEIKNGTWRHPRNRGSTIRELAEAFLEAIKKEDIAQRTREFYEQRTEVLLPHFGDLQVASLRRQDIVDFRSNRVKEVSAATVNREITTLFRIINWAATEEIIPPLHFSTKKLKLTEAPFRTRVLSPEEEIAILNNSAFYQQAMIIAALDAGMHKKEIFGQLWEDVDFARNILIITASKKYRVRREIPMTLRLSAVLCKLERKREYVFTYRGEPILTDTKKGWYRILTDAKVQPIRFHDLRATFGTRLEELGVPAHVCKDLMGHSRQNVHDRYIRPTMPMKREAIAKLDRWLDENGLLRNYYENEKGKVVAFPANR